MWPHRVPQTHSSFGTHCEQHGGVLSFMWPSLHPLSAAVWRSPSQGKTEAEAAMIVSLLTLPCAATWGLPCFGDRMPCVFRLVWEILELGTTFCFLDQFGDSNWTVLNSSLFDCVLIETFVKSMAC